MACEEIIQFFRRVLTAVISYNHDEGVVDAHICDLSKPSLGHVECLVLCLHPILPSHPTVAVSEYDSMVIPFD